jgi:hypothetical protein
LTMLPNSLSALSLMTCRQNNYTVSVVSVQSKRNLRLSTQESFLEVKGTE